MGSNIGLTIHANRQAILDARRCLTWLERQGYTRLGILGTSIGSSIGYITLVHDPRVRAGVFLHVSTYFADVVRVGMTTNHVWEGLKTKVSLDELRQFWAPLLQADSISQCLWHWLETHQQQQWPAEVFGCARRRCCQ